jgi:hypothetical protein
MADITRSAASDDGPSRSRPSSSAVTAPSSSALMATTELTRNRDYLQEHRRMILGRSLAGAIAGAVPIPLLEEWLSSTIQRGTIKRIVPRDNESVNECWIADRDRFAYEGVYSSERLEAPMVRDDSGAWQETDWETALEVAGEHLKGIVAREGGDALGTLVGPTATIEEMYLAGRLTRGLGSANIDARLREADFSDQDRGGAFPALDIELEALDGVELLSRTEGIIPALETAHAVALLPKLARSLAKERGDDAVLVFNCSGRGDKDMETIAVNR